MITIRSQSKSLLIDPVAIDTRNEIEIVAFAASDGNPYTLGTYATRERCLEIIDEIQALIYPEPPDPMRIGMADIVTFSSCGTPFYQMPAE
jgi:hypothetical protein